MAFDAEKYTIKVQGNRKYLTVAGRLIWFRDAHPDWAIVTDPFEINIEKKYAIFRATIFNADGKIMATATKSENVAGFADYLEKAETGAVGRALLYCGFGTDAAAHELDEGKRLADTPAPDGSADRPNPSIARNDAPAGGAYGSRPGSPQTAPTNGSGTQAHQETPAQRKRREWEEAQGKQTVTAGGGGDDLSDLSDPFAEVD